MADRTTDVNGLSEHDRVAADLDALRSGSRSQKIAARERLARVFERRGMLDYAAECLEDNVVDGVRDPLVYERLASIYDRQDDPDRAMMAREAARDLIARQARQGKPPPPAKQPPGVAEAAAPPSNTPIPELGPGTTQPIPVIAPTHRPTSQAADNPIGHLARVVRRAVPAAADRPTETPHGHADPSRAAGRPGRSDPDAGRACPKACPHESALPVCSGREAHREHPVPARPVTVAFDYRAAVTVDPAPAHGDRSADDMMIAIVYLAGRRS